MPPRCASRTSRCSPRCGNRPHRCQSPPTRLGGSHQGPAARGRRPSQRKECLRSHCARYRHARRSRRRSRCAARRLRLTMTSIVASTGVGSPRPCLHPLFDRARARGCTGGRDDWRSGLLVDVERPRAKAPRVDVKLREPVPARKGGTRVDVPAIGEAFHLVHHEVSVHQGRRPATGRLRWRRTSCSGASGPNSAMSTWSRRPRLNHGSKSTR